MGWEDRNVRLYYYRKKKRNGRVFSEYIGTGKLAELIVTLDRYDRAEREYARLQWQHERENVEAVDAQLRELRYWSNQSRGCS